MSEQVQGLDEVKANLAKLAERYSQATVKAGSKGAQLVRTTAIKSIQKKSPGRTVVRYRAATEEKQAKSYAHVAAASGYAPNTDTGALARSVQVEVARDAIFVGSSLSYAAALEFGKSGMAARPWLIPALEQNRKNIVSLYQDEIKKANK